MKKTQCILVVFIKVMSLKSVAYAEVYKLGDEFDPVAYMKTPKVAALSRGSFDELPSAVSLLKYAPPIGSQGAAGSCVGWSVGYAINSIAYRITVENSKGKLKYPGAFSPSYVFNQVKRSEDCSGGSVISDALELLANEGSIPIHDFPYSDKSCSLSPSDDQVEQAEDYIIEDFRRLSSTTSQRSLALAVRRALANKHPVAFGMLVGDAFQKYKKEDYTLKISAQDNELLDSLGTDTMYQREGWGGHAMAVVGYDDNRDGGAFHVMNSWRSSWGDQGFIWIKYGDFIRWVTSAYEVIPQIPIEPAPPKPAPDFNGKVVLKGIHNNIYQQTSLPSGINTVQQTLHSGALLRAEVTVSSDSYVCIIGTDITTAKHKVLFPYQGQSSPLINANATMLLPGPTEDYYSRLDQQKGTDFLVVLHSREKLDIDKMATSLDQSNQPDIQARLAAVLGDRLVPKAEAHFNGEQGYSTYLGNNRVLADIIMIQHEDAPFAGEDKTAPKIVITSPEVDNADAYVDGDQQIRYVSGDEVVLQGIAQDESEITLVDISDAFDIKFSSRGPFTARVDLTDIQPGSSKKVKVSSRDKNNNLAEQTIQLLRVKP
jgi:hypothetical protein